MPSGVLSPMNRSRKTNANDGKKRRRRKGTATSMMIGALLALAIGPGTKSLGRRGTAEAFVAHPLPRARGIWPGRKSAHRDGEPPQRSPPPPVVHHVALRTRNITTSMQFYGLLGFEATHKFRAGPARAAWLSHSAGSSSTTRLELIEVPEYLLDEPEGMRRRAPDLLSSQRTLGWNHLALDVTPGEWKNDCPIGSLADWMAALNANSVATFGKTLNVGLEPYQQRMGPSDVYEIAFLVDPDGCLVELLHRLPTTANATRSTNDEDSSGLASGWEPWNGEIFLQ